MTMVSGFDFRSWFHGKAGTIVGRDAQTSEFRVSISENKEDGVSGREKFSEFGGDQHEDEIGGESGTFQLKVRRAEFTTETTISEGRGALLRENQRLPESETRCDWVQQTNEQ